MYDLFVVVDFLSWKNGMRFKYKVKFDEHTDTIPRKDITNISTPFYSHNNKTNASFFLVQPWSRNRYICEQNQSRFGLLYHFTFIVISLDVWKIDPTIHQCCEITLDSLVQNGKVLKIPCFTKIISFDLRVVSDNYDWERKRTQHYWSQKYW